MILRHFSIRTRLLAATAIVTSSLLALGAWGVIANQVGIQKVEALFDQANAASGQVARLRESLGNLRRIEAQLMALGTSNSVETDRMAGQWKNELAAIEPIIRQLQGAQIDGAVALAYAQKAEDKALSLGVSSDAILKAQQDGQVRIRDEMAQPSTLASPTSGWCWWS